MAGEEPQRQGRRNVFAGLRSRVGPLAIVLVTLVLLAILSLWRPQVLGPVLGPLPAWISFVVLASVAALHRPFAGRGITAGAAALPPLVVLAGPLAAAWAALSAVLLAEGARAWAGGRFPISPPTRPRPLASLSAAARTALATLVAGVVWGALAVPRGEAPSAADLARTPVAGLASLAAFAAVSFLLRFADRDRRLRDLERRRGVDPREALRRRLPSRAELGSLGMDALGWMVGIPVAVAALSLAVATGATGASGAIVGLGMAEGVVRELESVDPDTLELSLAAGRGLALALLGGVALLAAEATRLAGLRAASEERLGHLDRVRSAGQRMVGGVPEMQAVVDRIREEVDNVVPFHWLQFELLAAAEERREGDGRQSWWALPGGVLEDGDPEPASHPPPLPGIHRRPGWRVVERVLSWGERPGARLRLWCDPRQLAAEDLELLDALLPQMAASIRQSLLDREAREDRLTGTAVRRVLEKRLLGAYRTATEAGRSLAVIMCDLDHFKSINDTHGHLAGDQALATVASVLLEHKRTGDLLARYGGEEFTLLLEDAEGLAALAVAERLRKAVEELELEIDGTPVPLTVSAGVAAFPELHVKTATELLLLADGALYEAKRQGRNRCLLDLGGGRFLLPGGEVVTAEKHRPAPEPPRLFA